MEFQASIRLCVNLNWSKQVPRASFQNFIFLILKRCLGLGSGAMPSMVIRQGTRLRVSPIGWVPPQEVAIPIFIFLVYSLKSHR